MIHFLQVTPISCISPSGRSISHTTQVSYVTGIPVKNLDTGRTTNRQHTVADGTEIIYHDIISYTDNNYTDNSTPLAGRLASMSSDLYNCRKQKNEVQWHEIENALPNYLSDDEQIELAHSIGMFLSKKWKRPIVVGIHKKTGNTHLHALVPGRELSPDGEWKNKRRKIYKDRQGRLIYDKIYKDADGHDIRQPLVPTGEQPLYDKNGVCVNQIKKAGRRQWDCSTHEGDVFSTPEVMKLHDEIDRIQNDFFEHHGIDDKVFRISPEVKKILQKAGLKQRHYGKRASEQYKQRCIENNRRYHVVAEYVAANLNRTRDTIKSNDLIRTAEEANAKKISGFMSRKETLQSELTEMDKHNPVTAYVETVLKPEQVYVSHEAGKALHYQADRQEICTTLIACLRTGWNANKAKIAALQAEPRTPRNDATAQLWTRNNNSLASLYHSLKAFSDRDITGMVKSRARTVWRGLTGWQRYAAIKNIRGSKAATIYKEYLMLSGNEPTHVVVPTVTVPTLKSIKGKVPAIVQQWRQDMASDEHLPPKNVAILHDLASEDSVITGEPITAPVPITYDQDRQNALQAYHSTITVIEQEEAAKRLNDTTPATRLDADEAYNSASAIREKEKTACIAATAKAKSKESGQPVEELVSYYRRYSKRFSIDARTYAPDVYARYKQAADDAQQKWKLTSRYQKIQATKEKMQSHSTEPQNSL